MLGTRPEYDNPKSALISHQFTQKLTGRFFVNGITGSFRKADELKRKYTASETNQAEKTNQCEQSKTINEEIRKETEQLTILEAKLLQIEKMKERHRMRALSRMQRRTRFLESRAASVLQRQFKNYMWNLKNAAADIVVNILKASLARQGLSAGFWALKVIKKFLLKVHKMRRALRARLKSIGLTADQCCNYIIDAGKSRALETLFQQMYSNGMDSKSHYDSPVPHSLASASGKIWLGQMSPARYDSNLPSSHSSPTNSMRSTNSMRFAQKQITTTEVPHNEPETSRSQPTAEAEAEAMSRIKSLHQQYLLQLENERIRRRKQIEQERLAKEAELRLAAEKQALENQRRLEYKNNYLAQLERRQLEQARMRAKLRLQREELLARQYREEEMISNEIKLMRKEDFRSRELRSFSVNMPRKKVVVEEDAGSKVPQRPRLSLEQLEEQRRLAEERVEAVRRMQRLQEQEAAKAQALRNQMIDRVLSAARKTVKKSQPKMIIPSAGEVAPVQPKLPSIASLRSEHTAVKMQEVDTLDKHWSRVDVSEEDYCNLATVDDCDDYAGFVDKQQAMDEEEESENYACSDWKDAPQQSSGPVQSSTSLSRTVAQRPKIFRKSKQFQPQKLPSHLHSSPYATGSRSTSKKSGGLVSELQSIISRARAVVDQESPIPLVVENAQTPEEHYETNEIQHPPMDSKPRLGNLGLSLKCIGPPPVISLEAPTTEKKQHSKKRSVKTVKKKVEEKVQTASRHFVPPEEPITNSAVDLARKQERDGGGNDRDATHDVDVAWDEMQEMPIFDQTFAGNSAYDDADWEEEEEEEFNNGLPNVEDYVPPLAAENAQADGSNDPDYGEFDDFKHDFHDIVEVKSHGVSNRNRNSSNSGGMSLSLQRYEARLKQEANDLKQSLLEKLSILDGL